MRKYFEGFLLLLLCRIMALLTLVTPVFLFKQLGNEDITAFVNTMLYFHNTFYLNLLLPLL